MLSKAYYNANDEHRNLETTTLSRITRKLDPLPLSKLVECEQSALLNQETGVDIFDKDRTLTVGNWKYELKITNSSLQRVKTAFEQSNNYAGLQPASQNCLPIHKTYRRIAELGAGNETYKYTLKWLDRLRKIVTSNQMWWCEPLVNLGVDSEIVFEWWYENKKLTVYILGNTAEYIKVWGIDIDNEMEDGTCTSATEIQYLWKWLVS
ncbi:hypothetical protein CEN47_05455 [Fischerella thermalis CCMEE 5319]|nr:hypothetical protein CEN47_05455 [Fischerella thermalis CCMEE 5319]